MNELIKELWHQSKTSGTHPEFGEYDKYSIETFAELIVHECVRYFYEDYQRDFDTLWREDLSKGIKEHFGVNT